MSKPKPHALPYRPGVGIMLFNGEKKIFVAKRIDMRSEAWQMPQGGIDEGEEARTTAWRELKEEIGTDHATIVAESKGWYTYDLPEPLIPVIWSGKFRGQRQKWFLMRFDGEENDINLQTEHPEFLEYKWVSPSDVPKMIVPFKQRMYQELIEEFGKLLITP